MDTLEISLDDVYPDENNPRKDWGDIDALADSFKATGGQPLQPIVVVRDGGIFRLIDGERRYRAMRKSGLSRCRACVCEDMDAANAMLAMLATDEKKPLTEAERGHGVQQALLLGVDPQSVEDALKVKHAARIKRAMQRVGDDAEYMSLDWLLAIDELRSMGCDEGAEELEKAKEKDWERVAQYWASKLKREREAQEMREALEAAGVAIVVDAPRMSDYDYMRGIYRVKDAQEIEWPAGCVATVGEFGATVYRPRDAEKDAEQARLDAIAAEFESTAREAARKRACFAVGKLMDGEQPEAFSSLACEHYMSLYGYYRQAEKLLETADWDESHAHGESGASGPLLMSIIYRRLCSSDLQNHGRAYANGNLGGDGNRRRLADWVADGEALQDDGYAFGEEEKWIAERVREAMGDE